MIEKRQLEKLYFEDKLSMMDIAGKLGCSQHKVAYWFAKHKIKRRTISEAIYQRANPNGDPFTVMPVKTNEDSLLLGLGLGLYWGEGTKANKYEVRLGNTDPELIKVFIRFLVKLFGIDKSRLRFGLQIFTDINQKAALDYWCGQLNAKRSQFYKVHVTPSGSIGTYKNKSQFGVLTVHFHNKKLRDIIVEMLPR